MANFILGIIMIILSAASLTDARRMTEALRKLRSLEPVGPDMYLAGIAVLLGILGAILIALSVRKIRMPVVTARVVYLVETHMLLVGALLLYALMLPVLGYPLATLAFFLAAFPVMGLSGWRWFVPSSIAATVVLYAVFVYLADMPLPADAWGLLTRSSQ